MATFISYTRKHQLSSIALNSGCICNVHVCYSTCRVCAWTQVYIQYWEDWLWHLLFTSNNFPLFQSILCLNTKWLRVECIFRQVSTLLFSVLCTTASNSSDNLNVSTITLLLGGGDGVQTGVELMEDLILMVRELFTELKHNIMSLGSSFELGLLIDMELVILDESMSFLVLLTGVSWSSALLLLLSDPVPFSLSFSPLTTSSSSSSVIFLGVRCLAGA